MIKAFLAVVTVMFVSSAVYASEQEASYGHEEEKAFNVNEMIMHHISDAHEWHLWGDAHNGTTIYLPIILMDGGLKMFSSSHLYHGESVSVTDADGKEYHYTVGEGPAEGYAIFHEKIYKLEHGKLHFEEGHPHNAKPMDFSEKIFLIL